MQQVQTTTLPNGSIIQNRYMIDSLLGKGGFGAVYLVHDIRVQGNQFALKEVVEPKKQDRAHFLFEGKLLERLDSIALPRVYRVFEDATHARVYLLMDYIDGPNLNRLRQLQPEKRFALPDMLRLMTPIVEAVIYLQAQKPPIIHRDIKPSNIIVPPSGDGPVLVDFGIAKEYDEEATTTAVRRLSPNYSAPEQYSQGTNLSTDVYGMAATFYTLLTGTPPIDAFERITQKGETGIDPLKPVSHFIPDIPPSVDRAIARAMALASDERFPTMAAFWNALEPQSFIAPSPLPVVTERRTSSLEPAQSIALLANAMTSPNGSKQQQVQKQQSTTRRTAFPLLTLLALAAMLLGALFGTSYFAKSNRFHSSASARTPITQPSISPTQATSATTPSPTSSSRTPTPAATVSATPSPAAKPKPTPTSAPTYPNLDSQYSGGIHNTPGNIDGSMTLTNVHQNGANISGTLILTNGLSGTASFTNGTVTSNNSLQFMVVPYTQYPPLLFQGHINADGSLTGTYCSVQNNQCDYAAGGYGTWRVLPPSPSSVIPSSNWDLRA